MVITIKVKLKACKNNQSTKNLSYQTGFPYNKTFPSFLFLPPNNSIVLFRVGNAVVEVVAVVGLVPEQLLSCVLAMD